MLVVGGVCLLSVLLKRDCSCVGVGRGIGEQMRGGGCCGVDAGATLGSSCEKRGREEDENRKANWGTPRKGRIITEQCEEEDA